VVDAITQRTGSDVTVHGHSYGGLCAFGAAPLTPHLRPLLLYEGWPGVEPERLSADAELLEHLEALLEQGQRERVLEIVLRDIVGCPTRSLWPTGRSPPGQLALLRRRGFPVR
jgi:hypothetical protein